MYSIGFETSIDNSKSVSNFLIRYSNSINYLGNIYKLRTINIPNIYAINAFNNKKKSTDTSNNSNNYFEKYKNKTRSIDEIMKEIPYHSER
jgi:hypothetical protein